MFELYSADGKHRSLPAYDEPSHLRDPSLYQCPPELADAVNVALNLGQPLLLTGESGTGKTELANHLAWFFQVDRFEVRIQTTSTAKDLFYRYDALGHFQYSNNPNSEALGPDQIENKFIHYQGLGAAIQSNKRSIVLLDEIDKAPRDLPNDVLAAIEDMSFSVDEIGKKCRTDRKNRPVVILTSNSEKNLPDPFLRRVVYFHIDFPNESEMAKIVGRKIQTMQPEEMELALVHFYKLRELALRKKPATAELLLWISLLKKRNFDFMSLGAPDKMSEAGKDLLTKSYLVLGKTREDLEKLQKGAG